MKVAIHLANGFEEIEALTVVDILRRADVEVKMVSVTGNLKVEGAHSIHVIADTLIEDMDYAQVGMIVLPGGMPGTVHLEQNKRLQKVIVDFYEKGKYIAAICAAPSILGKLHILEGKKATCYPGFEQFLYGAEVVEDSVVQSDFIITSRGPSTAILFSLKILENIIGSKKVLEITQNLLM